LKEIAKKYNITISQLAIHYSIQRGILPSFASLNKKHIQEDLEYNNFLIIDNQDMETLNNLNKNNHKKRWYYDT
jgi:diketogulonate reductase-like aldo/keto reductase